MFVKKPRGIVMECQLLIQWQAVDLECLLTSRIPFKANLIVVFSSRTLHQEGIIDWCSHTSDQPKPLPRHTS